VGGRRGCRPHGIPQVWWRRADLPRPGPGRPGRTIGRALFLHDVLPRNLAREFMQFVLRTASVGLARGQAGAAHRGRGGGRTVALLPRRRGAAARHGRRALRADLGGGRRLRDTLLRARLVRLVSDTSATTPSARSAGNRGPTNWCRTPDCRAAPQRFRGLRRAGDRGGRRSGRLPRGCRIPLDDAAGRRQRGELCRQLETLSRLVVAAAQEYVKVVAIARSGREAASREDMQDLLSGDPPHCRPRARVRRRASARPRRLLVVRAGNFRELYVLSESWQKSRTGRGRADARRAEVPRPRPERSRCSLGERNDECSTPTPAALFLFGGKNPVVRPGSVEEMGFKALQSGSHERPPDLPVPQAFRSLYRLRPPGQSPRPAAHRPNCAMRWPKASATSSARAARASADAAARCSCRCAAAPRCRCPE
jgi:hypothetical protein